MQTFIIFNEREDIMNSTNFCALGKMRHQMAICGATNEKECIHYTKASKFDRCMWKSIWLTDNTYHCANRDAQLECRLPQ